MSIQSLIQMLQEFQEEYKSLCFSEVLQRGRYKIGISRAYVCSFTEIPYMRMRYLEAGYFQSIPTDEEIKKLCELYDLSFDVMKEKAQKEIDNRWHPKKRKLQVM